MGGHRLFVFEGMGVVGGGWRFLLVKVSFDDGGCSTVRQKDLDIPNSTIDLRGMSAFTRRGLPWGGGGGPARRASLRLGWA